MLITGFKAIRTIPVRTAALAAAVLLASCAGGTASLRALAPDQQRRLLVDLQAADQRVATVAYRLASAGHAICPRKARLIGMTLHESAQYAPALRGPARSVMNLTDRVGVLAVAADSPAAQAGIVAGDGLIAIGSQPVTPAAPGRKGVYAGVGDAYVQLNRAAAAGDVEMSIERAGRPARIVVKPVPGCLSQVQLLPSPRVHAKADGTHLSVTSALVDYVANDDELALVIAHEMAHNALGHRARFEAEGVRRGLFGSYGENVVKVRSAEREADRLGYFLMARARYDPGVSQVFWPRLYAGPAGGHRIATTHPDVLTRLADARQAQREIEAARASGLVPVP